MEKMLGPTGVMLVGAIFVCFCLISAAEQPLNKEDTLCQIKEFHSDFINHRQSSDTGKLQLSGDTVYFPWASRQVSSIEPSSSDLMPRSAPVKEKIILSGSLSEEQVQDLKVMNSAKQRDIVYEEFQRKDPESQSLVNSMGVRVVGPGQDKKGWPEDDFECDGLERFVDSAVASGLSKGSSGKMPGEAVGNQRLGNYLDIDVSGITVSAINTVKGGSAVATSNIIVKPVQVIVCPSEIEEKLK